jgi:hypothetical protein
MGFPCNPVGFSACRAPSLKDVEPPRKASNLSPEPIPSEPVRVHSGVSYRCPAVFFGASICLSRAREYQILHNRAAVNVSGQRLA